MEAKHGYVRVFADRQGRSDLYYTVFGIECLLALRVEPPLLPEVSELQAVRHYTNLSRKNFSIDTQFYPLGSCTMKYNPKSSEALARLPGFAGAHPLLAVEMMDRIARTTEAQLWQEGRIITSQGSLACRGTG